VNSAKNTNTFAINPNRVAQYVAIDEAATVAFAYALAPLLQIQDIILLDGSLAAGKTFFVRNLVECLGTVDQVSSPTYAIANMYQTPNFEVLHVDAYRLKDVKDFYNLGLEAEVDNALSLIEWGSSIAPAFDSYLKLSISLLYDENDARLFEVSALGARPENLLNDLIARGLLTWV